MSIIAKGQITIAAITDLSFEDICTQGSDIGIVECNHGQEGGCVRIVALDGRSEQVQTVQGKNLCPPLEHWKLTGGAYLENGWIVLPNSDSYASIDVEWNKKGSPLYFKGTFSSSDPQGGAYFDTFYLDDTGTTLNMNGWAQTYGASEYTSNITMANAGEYSDALSKSTIVRVSVMRDIQYAPVPYKFKDIFASNVDVAYEPFVPTSPSPQYPSEIHSVGDDGQLRIVSSKYPRNLVLNSKLNKTSNMYGFGERVLSLQLEAGKTYCLTANGHVDQQALNDGKELYVCLHEHTWSGSQTIAAISTLTDTITYAKFTCLTSGNYVVTSYLYPDGGSRLGKATVNWVTVVEGDKPLLDWVPAPEDITLDNAAQFQDLISTAIIPLSAPLRSLPDGTHDILECKDGVWGITRNVSQYIVSNNTNLIKSIINGSVQEYYISNVPNTPDSLLGSISNIFIPGTNNILNSFAVAFGQIYIRLRKEDYPDIISVQTMFNELSLKEKTPAFLYASKIPVFEILNERVQKQLNNLISYLPNNFIYTTDSLATNFSVSQKSRVFYKNLKLLEEIKNTNSSLSNLDEELKSSFYDGIINTNEAEAIRKSAETMQVQITNQWGQINLNPSLFGTPKSNLQIKYNDCSNAYTVLMVAINTAVDYCSVESTKTDAQKKTSVSDMNTAYSTYKTKLADYQIAYQDAIDAIAGEKAGVAAKDAVAGLQIGGRNLFIKSDLNKYLPPERWVFSSTVNWSLDSGNMYNGSNSLKLTSIGSSDGMHSGNVEILQKGKTYTWSFYIKSTETFIPFFDKIMHMQLKDFLNTNEIHCETNLRFYPDIVLRNEWTKVSVTFDVPDIEEQYKWSGFIWYLTPGENYNVCQFKLEEGNKATDWTPAPEDLYDNIESVSATLSKSISDVSTIVDKAHKSITDKIWETDITTTIENLNVGGINLWDINQIKRYSGGTLSTIVSGTTVNPKSGTITLTSNPADIPGCVINTVINSSPFSSIKELVISGYFDRTDTDNDKYSNVKLNYKCFDSSNAQVQEQVYKILSIDKNSTLFVTTLDVPSNTAYINLGIGQYPYVKPYTLTGIMIKDSALYDITKDMRDRITQTVKDIDGFKSTVSNTYTTKTDFDNLSVGGRNYFRQSGRWNERPSTEHWSDNGGGLEIDSINKYLGYDTIKTTVGAGINGYYNSWIELDINKTYTYSAMIMSDRAFVGEGGLPLHYHCSTDKLGGNIGIDVLKYQQSIPVPSKWTLLYLTFKPLGKYWRPFIYYGSVVSGIFNIAYLKLEEGNKATDWTPAPEDVDQSIKSVKTLAEQLADRFTWVVKSGTDESNMQLTDRALDVVAERINLKGLVRFSGLDNSTKDTINSVKTYTDTAKNHYGYQHYSDIVIYGDSDKYYPVIIKGGDQTIKREILINRFFSEQAPSEWNPDIPTHHGGLSLKLLTNFGGWGGSRYSWCISDLEEEYCRMFAGAQICLSYMGFAIYLRGGGTTGALYHLYSDQSLTANVHDTLPAGNKIPPSPQICYDNNTWIGYSTQEHNWKSPPPRTITSDVEKEIMLKKYTEAASNAVDNAVLTPSDKIGILNTWKDIQSEYNRLVSQCTNLGVANTLASAYENIKNLFTSIVGSITLQNSTTTGFNKNEYDILYEAYITTKEALEKTLVDKVYEYTKSIKNEFTPAKALSIAEWCHNQNIAMIDGSYVYAGSIAATQIAANAITADKISTDAIRSKNYVPNNTGTFFNLADGTLDSKNFKINQYGDVSLTGSITANKGYIGNSLNGFTIDEDAIYNGMDSLSSLKNGIYLGTKGMAVGGGKFSVTNQGYLYAINGLIGGFSIGETKLYSGKQSIDENIGGVYIGTNGISTSANTGPDILTSFLRSGKVESSVNGKVIGLITGVAAGDKRYYSFLGTDEIIAISFGKKHESGTSSGYYFINCGGNPAGYAERHQFYENAVFRNDVNIEGVLKLNGISILDAVYPIGSIYLSISTNNPSTLFGGVWVSWGTGRVPVGVDANQGEFNIVEKPGGAKTQALSTANLPAHNHGLNNHTHSLPAHNHGLNNHAHSIPSLSGKAASAGAHTHTLTYEKALSRTGTLARIAGSATDGITNNAMSSNGAHTHTVTTNATTSGGNSGSTANSGTLTSGGCAAATVNEGSGTEHNNLQPYITCYMWKRTA